MRRPGPHFPVPREFRVSFADRLANAVVVASDEPLPPLRPVPAPPPPNPTADETADTPIHITNDHRPTPPTDLWVTEIGAQLTADRRAIETVLDSLTTAVGRLQADHSALLHACRRLAVELATSIAAKLLHERITTDQFNLEQMIRDMAADMPEDEIVSVRLNPQDLELLEKRLDGQPLLSGPDDPQLLADTTLARGECRVEGRVSVSLSDLPRQLGQIRDDLLRRVADARS
ncbi:MAG: FliH/SctL family protein [Fimbriiglobus sp.]|jgi:hypothetical protein|nr:FliH/SctL family protein [Fimbriiglobus sp.]